MALMSGHHIDFVALDLALQDDRGTTIDDPLAEPRPIIARASSLLVSSSWAICNPDRLRPMRYKQAIQVRSG